MEQMGAPDTNERFDRRTMTFMVDWQGPDDSNEWKGALARAVEAGLARARRELPGWEPAHPVDPEWLSANGHTYWQERSNPPAGSPFVKTLYYATVDFRPAQR
jgi:hypothetical protein